MKTFTLRLTDLEAEALDRIAYFDGRSKNKVIESLIACRYNEIEGGTVEDGELYFLSLPEELADFFGPLYADNENATRGDIALAIKYYDFGIENHSGSGSVTVEQLEEKKARAIEKMWCIR